MPSLLVYPYRGILRKIQISFLSFDEKPDCLIVSPGGCGSTSLITYLDKFNLSNLYFEKKYKFIGLGHIYKPSSFLKKNKIKIILIHRDYDEIYNSMLSRGFIRNSLNFFGDCFPFFYINFFKNKEKLKKKYFQYLDFFYSNWNKYDKNIILNLNYKDIYQNLETQKKIEKFLNIKDKNFIQSFPKFKKYKKDKDFVDQSTILSRKIHNL